MAGKRSKTDPTEDFDDLFEGIGDDSTVKKPAKSKASAASKGKPDTTEQDILAELEDQLVNEKPSRPHTPRIRETAPKSSLPSRPAASTPPPPQGSEEKASNIPRKSGESTRSYHASFTPSATSSELQEPEKTVATEPPSTATTDSGGGGGGWWGGILSTASAAMKQAEAAAKAIQQNEEAKKWTEQVRGINVGSLNVGALKGFSMSCQNLGLKYCGGRKQKIANMVVSSQAKNSVTAPCQPLPTSSKHSPLPSPPTNAFSYTLPTTCQDIRPSTP
jgi:hypothetical protein